MNSAIYSCRVAHSRSEPVEHRFVYPYLAFLLDLDELPVLDRKLRFFGQNRFSLFSFWDNDHIHEAGRSARDRVVDYMKSKGQEVNDCKIYLLTQVRFLMHVFNPVSFYFCVNRNGRAVCVVPEVNNTFREMKFYFLGRETLSGQTFCARQVKNFYVSPFAGLSDIFEFRIKMPSDRLNIAINDYRAEQWPPGTGGRPFLRTQLIGVRRELTDLALVRSALAFPFMTIRVVLAIHWQAFRLLLKRAPYQRKAANPHLQTEVYHAEF